MSDTKVKEEVETRKVTKDEAAFILGQGGKTKAKLCAVSGAQIDLAEGKGRETSSSLQIRGTPKQRKAARKYIEFVVAQRLGPVKIDDPSAHDDLTILTVPADTVSFITGRQGSFLRLVEEEWSALLFFLQLNPKAPRKENDPNATERLAIFGPDRRRRGAQLKVMAAIEMKLPGYFTKNVGNEECPDEGFGTDTMTIREEDYSYALGRSGATRKKLARASSCIVEYVGRVAYFCGTKRERSCAREYLQWLLMQRVGEHVHVDHKGRDDVTLIMVPSSCIGYVTGHKGSSLRAIEEETCTFCFIEGTVDDGEDQKPLLIFGCLEDRCLAETLVWERMSTKFDDLTADYGGGSGKRKGKGGKDKGGKGRHQSTREEPKTWAGPREPKEGESVETMTITDEEAAFLMGPGGKTKRKIAAVSGADLELKPQRLDLIGTPEERGRAKKYVDLVMAQRNGPVRIENLAEHDDLSIIDVPADAVSFVTGKQGSFLRLVEEEFGTLLFFLDFNKTSKRDQLERLAIFGSLRERRGAELKVMAAIEMKQPGYFTTKDSKLPQQDPAEGFATDRLVIEEEDYSYALGKGGATRKKIARASNCVIEYIGRLAYLSGLKKERACAREYLGWLFQQRVGPVEVDFSSRDDVTVMQVPKDCVGFVTGHKGTSLRAVEEASGTFCFIEGGREDPHRDPKPLLVFGGSENRKQAEEMLRKRIDQKLAEGWVHEDAHEKGERSYSSYSSGFSYKGYRDREDGKGEEKGGRKGNGKKGKDGKDGKDGGKDGKDGKDGGKDSKDGGKDGGKDGKDGGKDGKDGKEGKGWAGKGKDKDEGVTPGDAAGPALPVSSANPASWLGTADSESAAPRAAESAAPKPPVDDDDEDGAWGDWGGGSSDEDDPKAPDPKANLNLMGARGKWGASPYSSSMAAAMSSPQRAMGGSGVVGMGYSPVRSGEELDMPMHLMQEESWPELGQMSGKK
eukprot:TRINITY_DN2464_c0_g1_i1.p1 TRINITY_DN2464_c0_g1~~TRINITY_DN2464_c0_g1_i1.p1  ORF type:complete len:966 (+),score=271.12 TRINITY_DN2464_c0_g1_i1:240-3137(+)